MSLVFGNLRLCWKFFSGRWEGWMLTRICHLTSFNSTWLSLLYKNIDSFSTLSVNVQKRSSVISMVWVLAFTKGPSMTASSRPPVFFEDERCCRRSCDTTLQAGSIEDHSVSELSPPGSIATVGRFKRTIGLLSVRTFFTFTIWSLFFLFY